MCGIFCSICYDGQSQSIDPKLYELLRNRGPDKKNVLRKENILFGGFVLWQQGQVVSPQPACLRNWTLLLNGDIFNKNTGVCSSDTSWLIKKLSTCTNDDEMLSLFKAIKGPYSVIMYDCNTDSLYFARDPLGRNSLIIERDSSHFRILSNSLICESKLERFSIELPPYGLYKVNVKNIESVSVYPWISSDIKVSNCLQLLHQFSSAVTVNKKFINPDWLLPSENQREAFDFYQLCSLRAHDEDIYGYLLNNKNVNDTVCEFLDLLRHSVKERVLFTPKFCTICIENIKLKCNHSKIGILFSGGIDCTILAIIADKFVDLDDSIDLINVAFEAPNTKDINWEVPDRCSAKESFEELTRLCPERAWNLVEVNVTRKELNSQLESHIKHLIYPLNTVLDESLGCAFWFASRGEGCCNGKQYKSTTRVLLIGSGADELFGGYTRHRNAFTRCEGSHNDKLLSLSNELEMDWQRLPSRNLGRDDRVIADNGKTSRAPFIQEDLVHFVRSLNPVQRCCFMLEQGVGDKIFLRISGYKLGLRSSVKLKKRAIQFGSRIANKKQNAKDVSTYLR